MVGRCTSVAALLMAATTCPGCRLANLFSDYDTISVNGREILVVDDIEDLFPMYANTGRLELTVPRGDDSNITVNLTIDAKALYENLDSEHADVVDVLKAGYAYFLAALSVSDREQQAEIARDWWMVPAIAAQLSGIIRPVKKTEEPQAVVQRNHGPDEPLEMLASRTNELRPGNEPLYGTLELTSETTLEPKRVLAGGSDDLGLLVEGAYGFVNAERPDLAVNYTGEPCTIDFCVACSEDATLFIIAPSGTMLFSDDVDGMNPRVSIQDAQPGRYALWVGTYEWLDYYPEATVSASIVETVDQTGE